MEEDKKADEEAKELFERLTDPTYNPTYFNIPQPTKEEAEEARISHIEKKLLDIKALIDKLGSVWGNR